MPGEPDRDVLTSRLAPSEAQTHLHDHGPADIMLMVFPCRIASREDVTGGAQKYTVSQSLAQSYRSTDPPAVLLAVVFVSGPIGAAPPMLGMYVAKFI